MGRKVTKTPLKKKEKKKGLRLSILVQNRVSPKMGRYAWNTLVWPNIWSNKEQGVVVNRFMQYWTIQNKIQNMAKLDNVNEQ